MGASGGLVTLGRSAAFNPSSASLPPVWPVHMKHILVREQLVRRPRSEVFSFFADASNLDRLTPKSLRFKILGEAPRNMRAGTTIKYQLSLFRVPFSWRTLIDVFEPEQRFVDVQLEGPYRAWRHTHEFIEAPHGTMVLDRVEYELPFGPLGGIAHAVFVRRQLRWIFDFRRDALARIFDGAA